MGGLQFSAVSPKAAFCFRLSLQLQSWLFKSFSGNCGEAKNEVKISSCFM